jgi:hypothetical protein
LPRPTRFYSKQQEIAVAKALGGKRVANSGATPFNKGDVRTNKFLLECKTCTEPRKSITIRKEWIEKNKEEAFAMRKDYSAVVFDFGDNKDRYYIIDERLFKELINYLEGE